jgi:hypothetical protein
MKSFLLHIRYMCFVLQFAYLAADAGAPSTSDYVALILWNVHIYVFSMWCHCAAICSVVSEM